MGDPPWYDRPVRKLPPSILAALGLPACVDGCDPTDLPVVRDLFDDDEPSMHPCLNVAMPRPADTDEPVLSPVPIGPCLEMMPEPRVGPCLKMPPQPRVGPCLDFPAPAPTPPPRVGPCLRMMPDSPVPAEVPVHPCLSVAPPEPPLPTPPDGDRSGSLPTPRDLLLAKLAAEGILPQDVVDRVATTGTAGRPPR